MNKALIQVTCWIFLTVALLQLCNFILLESPWLFGFLRQIPFLDFALIWNQGIAFGIGHGQNLKWLFICMSIIVCAIFFFFGVFVAKNEIGTVLVVSGGLSNLIDRLIHGAVLDFVRFNLDNFPLFNLSDILISLGVLSFVLREFRKGNNQ